jgi:hypothetical protein
MRLHANMETISRSFYLIMQVKTNRSLEFRNKNYNKPPAVFWAPSLSYNKCILKLTTDLEILIFAVKSQ